MWLSRHILVGTEGIIKAVVVYFSAMTTVLQCVEELLRETREQAKALCTVLEWYTLSKTSLGWARRGTPAWIRSMWAQGLATSLYTQRPGQKRERVGRERRHGEVLKATFRRKARDV